MPATFDLQGHRGARGLKPENTLSAFETALDLQVSTLETDLHLTRDGVPVISHEPILAQPLARVLPGARVPALHERPRISSLTLAQLRSYVVDGNPDPRRFPNQDRRPTPVAGAFARELRIEPYTPPTLADLLQFVNAYAGDLGRQADKTDAQRARARTVRFNLELKRVPYRPVEIGDTYDGTRPGDLERRVIEEVRRAGVAGRTIIQSFDHRAVRFARQLEPRVEGSALIYGTTPVAPGRLVHEATAQIYSPDFEFLDREQIRQVQQARLRVVPWTVNDEEDMRRLLDWQVDGLITDFPDRLASVLNSRHITF